MGKKKRKDLTEENLTNTDVGFGEMAIQQTITNCSDIAKNTAAIVERIGAKLDSGSRTSLRAPKWKMDEFGIGRVHHGGCAFQAWFGL